VYSELLNHPDPIVRFRYRTQVLEEDPRDPGVEQLQDEIRT
jgi:hypothetical protein